MRSYFGRAARIGMACAAFALLQIAPVRATAPAAWAAYAKELRTKCAAASGLRDVKFLGLAQFGDDVGLDAVRLIGRYPQPFMHGKTGTEICLFNRRDRRAHVSELATFP